MNRRQLGWFVAVAMLTLLAAVSAPAFPEPPEPREPEATSEPTQGVDATVEMILRQQEGLLTGQPFSYDPEGRRDPFRSLFGPKSISEQERPQGIAGMSVTEIDLAGVVSHPSSGDVAMVIGSDNKGYFLRVGDQIYDASVISVDEIRGSVTFRQEVDDPRLIKPYRDVVKRLVPLNEERADD